MVSGAGSPPQRPEPGRPSMWAACRRQEGRRGHHLHTWCAATVSPLPEDSLLPISMQVYISVPRRKDSGREEGDIGISLTRLLHSREIDSTGLTANKTGSVPSVLVDTEE